MGKIFEYIITFIKEHPIITLIIIVLIIISFFIKSIKLALKDEETNNLIKEKDKYIASLFSFLAEYISGTYINKSINYILILKYKEQDCFYLDCINNNNNRILHGFAYFKENIDINENHKRYFSVMIEGDREHNLQIMIKDKNCLFIEYNTTGLEPIKDIKNLQGVYERKID